MPAAPRGLVLPLLLLVLGETGRLGGVFPNDGRGWNRSIQRGTNIQRAWEWAKQQPGEEPGEENRSRQREEVNSGPQQIKATNEGGSKERQCRLRHSKMVERTLGGHKENDKRGHEGKHRMNWGNTDEQLKLLQTELASTVARVTKLEEATQESMTERRK